MSTMSLPQSSTVRLLKNGRPMGAGCLVSPEYVLTCTHVVIQVLDITEKTLSDRLTTPLELDFPLLPRQPAVTAIVEKWYPVIPKPVMGDIEDIALLKLQSPLPIEASPTSLSAVVTEQEIKLFGFPKDKPEGVYLDGTLKDSTGKGLIEIHVELGYGDVEGGFSGSPVWDVDKQYTLGLIKATEKYGNNIRAYMIPASNLLEAMEFNVPKPSNPYRGLSAFREQDADLFFGRQQVVAELTALVEKQPFVAVIGASGSGKSSVVFAGLIPQLRQTGQWLIVQARPKTQPFMELAIALVPLLYQDKLDQAEKLGKFEKGLKTGDLQLNAIFQLIQQEYPNQRLLLVIDQFEEIYTLIADKALQQKFIDVLLQPTSSANVLLLTIRADFMGAALSHDQLTPVLNPASKRDSPNLLMLGRMTDTELQAAIEQPALTLGVKLAEGLTQHILEEIGREAGSLPLLQFALTELWERQQYRQLTHEAYQDIGGVNQALARHADKVFEELDQTEQAKMRQIFVQLVRPGEGTEDTRQVATLAQVLPENQVLVAKLATARLVVTNRDEQEQETVEVVHEALIRHWGQLRQWVNEDRAFRRWQNGLREAMKGWQESKQDQEALLQGVRLLNAEDKLNQYRDRVADEERQFIEASVALRVKKEQRRRRSRLIVLATLVITIVLTGLLLQRIRYAQKLESYQWQIMKYVQELESYRRKSQTLQSRFLASSSRQQTEQGNATNGMLLALEGLPRKINDPKDRPFVAEAHQALYAALLKPREVRIFEHKGEVNHATFSRDGQRVVTASGDKTAKVWEVASGKLLATLAGHEESVTHAAFSRDGQRVVTASGDKTAKLWEVASGKLLATLVGHEGEVDHATFSPDGQRVVTASGSRLGPGNNTAKLWEVASGKLLATLARHEDSVSYSAFSPAFSPDGQRVVTAGDNIAKVWEVASGQLLATLEGHQNYVNHAAFSPDSQLVVITSIDRTARLWEVASGKLLATLAGHESVVNHAAFNLDGQQVVTASDDNTAKLWEVTSGKLLATLAGHKDSVNHAAFSPDGQRVVTASSDNTAKIWRIFEKQELIEEAERSKTRDLTIAQRERFFLPVPEAMRQVQEKVTQGEEQARAGNFTAAQNAFIQAIQLDNTLRFDPTVKARVLTINALLAKGEELAKAEQIESAIAAFEQVKALESNFTFDSKVKVRQIAVSSLIEKGESLAQEGKLDEAIAIFKRAQELDASLTFDPQMKANQVLAAALVGKGESLAQEEKLNEAIAMFKRAQELDASLTFDAQMKANQVLAAALVGKGESLAQEEKLNEAIAMFKRAQELDANVEISANGLNVLCWQGSLAGQVAKVLESCETAVKLTNEQDASIRDSRGLARALTGNFKGAITDFQFFVQHTDSEEEKKQRQSWIKALKKGKNPLTEEVLQSLKGQ